MTSVTPKNVSKKHFSLSYIVAHLRRG